MTVSRALRDDPAVSAAERQRIKKLAEKLGYRPDPVVSQLMARLRASRTAGTTPIGWLTIHATKNGWRKFPTNMDIFRGASERAAHLGYRLEEFWLGEPGMTGHRMSDILWHRNIRGIIIPPPPAAGMPIDLAWERFACATCGYLLRQPNLHRACSHQFHAARIAWQNLTCMGRRRIGLAFSEEWDEQLDGLLLAGFLREQRSVRGSLRVPPLVAVTLTKEVFLKWYNQHRPDAVLGFPDACDWLREEGIRVPGECEIALINIEDGDKNSIGVNHHMRELGAAVMDLVIEQLNANQTGVPAVPKVTLVECAWRPSSK
ncbi:hypothetical protein AW736_04190 [Termitidicoccus mucosus]|uniref:HTH lacI-type domain-containing protein n=2 Tax=Termitidicoccus mucosus TaxID=1184151 RepID=A0A178IPS7_9BACT|nr:hypothetical protein AW736_04190 [Opitutaceae bacterium TSB47]